MTMRLDLRTRPDPVLPGHVVYASFPYGCADCGRWFQWPRELVQHDCEARHD